MTTAPAQVQPTRKAAQRLRWFLNAFETQTRQTSSETGTRYDIDQGKLASVFAHWIRAFNAQKPSDPGDKLPYVGFAAGLMLRALVTEKPVRVLSLPPDAEENHPAYLWPEGYLYVAFCLNVRGLVLSSDFDGEQHISESLGDPRVWWSFKENAAQDPSSAIAFLELFAGDTPNWEMPDIFQPDQTARIASQFYQAEQIEPGG